VAKAISKIRYVSLVHPVIGGGRIREQFFYGRGVGYVADADVMEDVLLVGKHVETHVQFGFFVDAFKIKRLHTSRTPQPVYNQPIKD